MPDTDILDECEKDCLTGDLIACPLSEDEKNQCEKRLIWLKEKNADI